MTVVSNAGPLIALERIERQELIPQLFGNVFIPPAVCREVFGSGPLPAWARELPPTSPLQFHRPLGPGEREAIRLALELPADWLLIDDWSGRREAAELGVPIIGTLGLLLMAKSKGAIPAVGSLLDALDKAGFFATEELRALILREAGEET